MGIKQPNGPARFHKPSDMGPREWGKEILLYTSPGNYTLKRIEMKAGTKGGLQYHHKKDEGGVIIEGEMIVRYDPGDGTLKERACGPGSVFHFPQGSVHQGEAVTDVVYIEVSTPFFNDRVHVESEYGIEAEAGGLPSTRLEDVVAA
jgi:mannose-6-phosphate isomerase